MCFHARWLNLISALCFFDWEQTTVKKIYNFVRQKPTRQIGAHTYQIRKFFVVRIYQAALTFPCRIQVTNDSTAHNPFDTLVQIDSIINFITFWWIFVRWQRIVSMTRCYCIILSVSLPLANGWKGILIEPKNCLYCRKIQTVVNELLDRLVCIAVQPTKIMCVAQTAEHIWTG